MTLRWAIMAVGAALLLLLLDGPRLSRWVAAAGAVFLIIVLGSVADVTDPLYGIDDGVHLLALATVFCLGSALDDLTPAWEGLALGVAISGLMALLQVLGFSLVEQVAHPAGLFMNKNFLAEAGVITVIPMLLLRRRWLLPALFLAAVLPMSKGSLLALFVVSAMLWRKGRKIDAAALAGITALVALTLVALWALDLFPSQTHLGEYMLGVSSAASRFEFWRDAFGGLTWFGSGLSSFAGDFPRIGNAHSEPVQALYEFGVFALIPAGIAAYCWMEKDHYVEHLILAAIAVLCLFSFPLHMPVTGFAAALALGHLAGARARLRVPQHDGGMARACHFDWQAHGR